MKFAITKRETLALVAFAIAKPTANIADGEARIVAWEDLRATELAAGVADAAAVGVPAPNPKPWLDNTKPTVVDLQQASLRFLLKVLEGEIPGVFSDLLRGLQRRLLRLEAGTYVPPSGARK